VLAGRLRGRDRRRRSLRRRPAAVLLGRAHAPPPRVRHPRAPAGAITKQGPRLVRWAAVEATQRLPGGSKQAAWFHRIADRRGTGIAPRRGRPQAPDPGLLRPARRPGALPGPGTTGGDVNGSGARAARARVCHDPRPGGVVARLIEPARLRPHSWMPPGAAKG
jgi:hypothetical protein